MIVTEVVNKGVEIDPGLVPAVEMGLFVKSLYEGALRFYENPENMRRFKEWQRKREKEENHDGH